MSTDNDIPAAVDPDNDTRPVVGISAEDAKALMAKRDEELRLILTTTVWYPYATATLDNGSTFQVYTGKSVRLLKGETPPETSSMWEPPSTVTEDVCSYFDGIGWVLGLDIRTMTLSQLQMICFNSSNRKFQEKINTLGSGWTGAEQTSWPQQVFDAQKLLSVGEASSFLTTLANARQMDVKDFAQKVMDKNVEYMNHYASILAEHQTERNAIDAATSIAELPKIELEDVLLM